MEEIDGNCGSSGARSLLVCSLTLTDNPVTSSVTISPQKAKNGFISHDVRQKGEEGSGVEKLPYCVEYLSNFSMKCDLHD